MKLVFAAALCATFASAATDPDALLERARLKVNSNTHNLPRYTCIQSLERSYFARMPPLHEPKPCSEILDPAQDNSGKLAWTDRMRLDVAVAGGTEIFSWAGASKFQYTDTADIASDGAMGTGDFGGFLADMFGAGAASFHYVGISQDGGESNAIYTYQVPKAKSHYRLRTGLANEIIGYHGTVRIDPQTADLKRLVIEADELPELSQVCATSDVLEYRRVTIGNSGFMLPKSVELTMTGSKGDKAVNTTSYDSCREYSGQSKIHFDDFTPGDAGSTATTAPVTIPEGVRFDIQLKNPVDSDLITGGDAVEGFLAYPVKIKQPNGQIIVPKGARVEGRVIRIQKRQLPSPMVVMSLRFDTVEMNGVAVPVALRAVEDKSGIPDAFPDPRSPRLGLDAKETRRGIGTYVYTGGHLVFPHFMTHWRSLETGH